MKTRVRLNEKGRGVYATMDLRKGEVVERAQVLVIHDREVTWEGTISHYTYYWGRKSFAIALGNGSLYNHSYDPNVKYDIDTKKGRIVFTTLREIRRGSELLINYNGDVDSKEPVHFLSPKLAKRVRGGVS